MIRRALRYSLLIVALLAVVVIGLSLWLLRTESGARFIWARAVQVLPEQLSAASVAGNLHDGVSVSGLRFVDQGNSVQAERLTFAVEPQFFGLAVEVHSLHVTDVVVQSAAAREPAGETSDTGAPASDILPSLVLPLTVRVNDLLINRATLLAADGTTVFALDKLGFDATWSDTLAIDRLQFAANDMQLSGSASVGLEAPNAVILNGEFITTTPGNAWLPNKINAQLGGNLQQLDVALRSNAPAIEISGTVQDVLSEVDVNVLATSQALPLPPEQARPSVQLTNLQLRITGGIDSYTAELATQLSSDYAAPVDVAATVRGNLEALQVESLTLASPELDASATGTLNWRDAFSVTAALSVQRLDASRWITEWPEAQFIAGQSELSFSADRLEISSLQATYSGSDATLTGTGLVDTQTGALDADIAWQQLQWPLPPAIARIESRAASLSLQGTLDAWALDGEIALAAADLPPGRFVLQGSGTRDVVNLDIRDSDVLGGRVVGQFAYAAADGGQWQAQLKTVNTLITPFAPAWPGRVSADFQATGTVQPFAVALDVQSLTGTVRERDVSASGAMRFTRDQLQFEKLRLQSGAARVALDGDWQDAQGVSFFVTSTSLADLLPAAAGSIEAQGRLRAGDKWPQLELELSAKDIAWQQWYAEELQLRNEPGANGEPFGLEMSAAGLALADIALQAVHLTLAGSPEAHQLELKLQRADDNLAVSLRGGATDLQSPDAMQWQGELQALEFAGRDDLKLSLRDPVPVQASRKEVRLASACVDISDGGALCTVGEFAAGGRYRASVELTDVPLNLLRAFTNTTLKFNQRLSGAIEIATGPRGRPSGNGRIDMTPGQIFNEVDERLTLRTRAGYAAFNLQEGQLLAGEINLPFSDAAEIVGTFRVIDITQGESSPIEGQLNVVVRDLGISARIVPQIDAAGGSLDANISVDGTLAKPGFGGGLTISNGYIVYDPLGLNIRDIQLDSKVLAENRVELTSTFSAGEGTGRITSSANYLQGRSGGFEVTLVGDRLKIIDLPDLSMVINPDLELGIRGDDIRINGKVVVPEARVASVAFVNTGVSESDDVVFVGATRPVDADAEESASRLNYSGSVALELGDNVVIDLDVAEARLRGSTTYRWQGEALPMASGSFGISGKFEAYGQLLEITEGAIRYVDVPASNPQLRIRAEREIFGNTQVRRAGVFVSGTAQRPKIEVYTNPATSPDRALSLLVTGSDFNYEQGVGAVDVGRYIAPRLYASYGIGLFDRENVISVRYDLAKGFGIKATSGRQAAGIDISYTIER